MSDGKQQRSYWVEGTLELGRNWALGLAITSAGLIAFRTETVTGPPGWEQWIFTACMIAATAWIVLAVWRFNEGVTQRYPATSKWIRMALVLPYTLLIATGLGLFLLVAEFSDNNYIVRMCDAAASRPGSRIVEYPECKRLQKQRQERFERLEQVGKPAGPDK